MAGRDARLERERPLPDWLQPAERMRPQRQPLEVPRSPRQARKYTFGDMVVAYLAGGATVAVVFVGLM